MPICKQTLPSASGRVGQGPAGCPRGQPGALARLSGDSSTLLSPLLRGKRAQGVNKAEGRHLKRGKFIPSVSRFLSSQRRQSCWCFHSACVPASPGEWDQSSPLSQVLYSHRTYPPIFNPVFLVLDGTSTPSALPAALVAQRLVFTAFPLQLWSTL